MLISFVADRAVGKNLLFFRSPVGFADFKYKLPSEAARQRNQNILSFGLHPRGVCFLFLFQSDHNKSLFTV